MFVCLTCGHPDYVHLNFAGRCCHGEMNPKDETDCDCEEMK